MDGQDIKEWREKHGLSQSQLAELLPVNLRTLQDWEYGRGKRAPYLERALRDLDHELKQSDKH